MTNSLSKIVNNVLMSQVKSLNKNIFHNSFKFEKQLFFFFVAFGRHILYKS